MRRMVMSSIIGGEAPFILAIFNRFFGVVVIGLR